jgi:norsolorinic acid ketoreductase
VSPKLNEARVSDFQPFFDVNAFAQLELFKAVAPLLCKPKSESKGKFMYISSLGGSLTLMSNIIPTAAYGASKSLGNWIFKWLSLEQSDIIVWAHHPG